ncbi:hypothetical protein HF086_017747 [Spodoptera exigua]|uniref:G-protein coupled receptors family 1 profile domain-containing protein n=1 Tax=Spodoptera exigua TaxID=7107 RepID=A0A922MA75_SPOEX|nr:hypothetical protein HF086_017747 [Spodoptera exigua]
MKRLAVLLQVTFLMMPLEIAWAGTVQWLAGDLMCRVMMFTRTFGLYLSSFVLICIAVDRYYAILKPLNVTWEARVRRALIIAWVCAGLASLPQSFIFHVEEHPDVKGYWIDKESLKSLDPAIQKAMWLFSCTNSCANPIVYGVFNRNRWSWRAGRNVRCRSGSMRRGSRLPYGESMEISAATLARARNSMGSERNGRRDSYNAQNGSQKHWNTINNNHVGNGMV